jgi:hypothetical protein
MRYCGVVLPSSQQTIGMCKEFILLFEFYSR